MKNNILFLAVCFICVVYFTSCKTNPQRNISINYTYKTECLGVDLDGSQTLKTWGNGQNKDEAIEQALKNAVRDVLFNGITNGKQDCNVKPVVTEVNAQDKYSDYFNKFFGVGGAYKEFVNKKDGSKIDKMKESKQAGKRITCGVVVNVNRAALVSKMKSDGILK